MSLSLVVTSLLYAGDRKKSRLAGSQPMQATPTLEAPQSSAPSILMSHLRSGLPILHLALRPFRRLPSSADPAGVLEVVAELGPGRVGQGAGAFERVQVAVFAGEIDRSVRADGR